MQIKVIRRILSKDDVVASLESLAQRYGIPAHEFSESSSERMNEFDALKWTSMCAQLGALNERESASHHGVQQLAPPTLAEVEQDIAQFEERYHRSTARFLAEGWDPTMDEDDAAEWSYLVEQRKVLLEVENVPGPGQSAAIQS